MPTAFLDPRTIVGDKVFTIVDRKELAFGLVSSSIFRVWQGAIGGRMKSDPSFGDASRIRWRLGYLDPALIGTCS